MARTSVSCGYSGPEVPIDVSHCPDRESAEGFFSRYSLASDALSGNDVHLRRRRSRERVVGND